VPVTGVPDTIFVTFSSYITIDGLRSFNANRAAVRIDNSPNITVQNGVFGNNATWGIFTDFSDHLLLQYNECYGSVTQHGIYVSNSGDWPIVRGNRLHDNAGAGVQLNADASQGGDGIITGALLENNVIYNNGSAGGSGINLDGVQGSTIRNNLLYNNHASGITMFQTDGAQGPSGDFVYHNTIVMAANGRLGVAHRCKRRHQHRPQQHLLQSQCRPRWNRLHRSDRRRQHGL
jgi:parallel beta-helix repeat protein